MPETSGSRSTGQRRLPESLPDDRRNRAPWAGFLRPGSQVSSRISAAVNELVLPVHSDLHCDSMEPLSESIQPSGGRLNGPLPRSWHPTAVARLLLEVAECRDDAIPIDPVVGPAFVCPVPDRWADGDGLTIEDQVPAARRKRGDDLAPAARTEVCRGGVLDRDVQRGGLDFARDLDHEPMDHVRRVHSTSPLMISFRSIS